MIDRSKIKKICAQYGILNWTIDKDGLVNVRGGVNLSHTNMRQLPLQFGIVDGVFLCSNNKLTTLKGSPNCVRSAFYCYGNKLTDLNFAPKHVYASFNCCHNNINVRTNINDIMIGGKITSTNLWKF